MMIKNDGLTLTDMFELAKKDKAKYVFVEVHIEGYPASEMIVNPIDNADKKLAYLLDTYNEDGSHKKGAPVSIVTYGYFFDMGDIEYVYDEILN